MSAARPAKKSARYWYKLYQYQAPGVSVVVRIRPTRGTDLLHFVRIVVVGVSHSSAPLPVLEHLSIPPGELDVVLARLKAIAQEGFVLSTCNRTEIYAVIDRSAGASERLLDLLVARGGDRVDEYRAFCYAHANDAAVKHALRVASGLDSMILGEDQIQAQLKRALGAARGAETLGSTLERLGAAALGCGKRVRAFTGVGHHAVSLESIAVDMAIERVGSLAGKDIAVLGSGRSAGIVVQHLKHIGAGSVTVVGRSLGSAIALASDLDAVSAPWDSLAATLSRARVVFCCTAAPHPVLTAETLEQRRHGRGSEPLLCVDLGMPRDVDVSVAGIDNVTVVTLEELGSVARSHRLARWQHVPAAEAIVAREAERFFDWINARGATGAIVEMRAQAEAVADAEVRRALARLQTASAEDRAVVSEMARRIVRKLVHDQTNGLKLHMEQGGFPENEGAVS